MKTTIKTIDVIAKEWFDKVNGNSYFSAVVTLNYGTEDATQIFLPFQYGYGDHYKQMAFEKLQHVGAIADAEKMEVLWSYCQRKGIILRASKHENCKKATVKEFGQP
jgi:hypothetical protein